ncbi:helix-turn-helix domain-containing protein [Geoglobus acetivorans]|uniref:Transcriptional regulator, TrmB family n=1 Tax=Geoglobus acetivorans TaxID=565033 RepID=A0A0A7GGY3_GEOAI|nr:Transcriptional regulator, TrmB family [Geoglobus acetivorans]
MDEEKLRELFSSETTFQNILKCILNLTPSEIEVYLALHEHPNTGVDELAEIIGKDRSGVYRSLHSLMEKGLVEREYRILKHGGYKYLYVPISIDVLKDRLRAELENWFNKLNEVVEKFSLHQAQS